ncbi:glycoside hydrolase family 88 protein [Clostridium grantii]|uniref:Unsaturated chondroitin disaccharide hydrolase n=1 Tax=Clostridium grantii DSM 8605 TaxID=1121316 RepID=A0A1M5VBC8_9CLOT|nr:glycoside hydrolase family 88 protein [Clostridium grantii]SHH72414.1 unsaturated chondroitin disaccharide hydrolase [Clostridium grantii DSM 8605]
MRDFKNLKFEELDDNLEAISENLQSKVKHMIISMGNKSPHVGKNGIYDDMRIDWWTSGFWPGILWIMNDMTGKDIYKNAAWDFDERIEQCFVRESNLHHDVGFQFLPTAVVKYKITGDMDARRRGLNAANFLAGRFNIVGNFLRAWNQDKIGWAIIDSSMNISLLFWAAEEIKDPRFKHIAKAHADTVVRHFIREDGSVCHIGSFDPESGEFIESLGGQGYGPNSAWSRGQSWALYGMANAYKYTGDMKYLRAAQKVAHFFLASLSEDYIPCWDFRVPELQDEPKDTSAAACAASGLLEIAKHLPEEEGRMYISAAKRIIHALTKQYVTWDDMDYEGLLVEGTGNKPNNENVNVSLIYGDYFYVECIAKLLGWENNIF